MSAISWAESGETRVEDTRAWDAAYGLEWTRAFAGLVELAGQNRVALEAGSSDLLISRTARAFGLSPLSGMDAQRERSRHPGFWLPRPGSWVLRTSPGARSSIQEMLDGMDDLAPFGRHPAIQIEESVGAGLPFLEDATAWPTAEAWCRAALLVETPVRGGRRRLPEPIVPENFDALVTALREAGRSPSGSRRLRSRDDVLVRAADLFRAAAAWDGDRASYWRARESLGFADGESRGRWIASARRWGLTPGEMGVPSSEKSRTDEPRTLSKDRIPAKDRIPGKDRIPVSKISRPAGGGTVSFPPLTVIAHDPRHAASRFFSRSRKDGQP